MRTKVIKAIIASSALGLALATGACSSQSAGDSTGATSSAAASQQSSTAPAGSASGSSSDSKTGTFHGLNGKSVNGTVTVADGTVTLSGFSSDEGPDLHLYLANGTDEKAVAAGTELGSVDFKKASQSFKVNGDASFTNVLVHCDKAKAVFGAASLT